MVRPTEGRTDHLPDLASASGARHGDLASPLASGFSLANAIIPATKSVAVASPRPQPACCRNCRLSGPAGQVEDMLPS